MLAKGMSWMKTNAKVMMDDSDATIADLIVDGCNMGIKTLCRHENQYAAADDAAMKLSDPAGRKAAAGFEGIFITQIKREANVS